AVNEAYHPESGGNERLAAGAGRGRRAARQAAHARHAHPAPSSASVPSRSTPRSRASNGSRSSFATTTPAWLRLQPGAAQCFGRTVMPTGLLVVTAPALSVARAVRPWLPGGTFLHVMEWGALA